MPDIQLNDQGDRRYRNGNVWFYSSDLAEDSETVKDGSVVDLFSPDGSFRARGFYSEQSDIRVKVISESKVSVDRNFFRKRLKRALSRRKHLLPGRISFRLCHGHGDLLPGLVVDKYDRYLIVQFRHPAIEKNRNVILDILEEEVDPKTIYARNDVRMRERYGLDQYKGLLRGEPLPDRVTVRREPFRLVADLRRGQKTGFYLDQEFNREQFRKYVTNGTGIDCFSYSGGWGFHALAGGARQVTFVDQSQEAIELVKENAHINGWGDNIEVIADDAFDFLNDFERDMDFIALDPPRFAGDESQLQNAIRGYKEINLQAMRLLKTNGILATSSCSTPISSERFRNILSESAHDAHVTCRIFEERFQGPDHPWLVQLPPTRYLNCFICEISLL